jgi:lysozyme family protein
VTTSAFDAALAFLRPAEGGYSDTPGDSGGPTNFGITLATLSTWRHASCTAADVQALTWAEAEAIYGSSYWNPVMGDSLPGPVAVSVFDEAVNAGVRTSSRLLQQCIGMTGADVDGWIGRDTLAALAANVGSMSGSSLSATALKVVQSTAGATVDGLYGPETAKAIAAHDPCIVLVGALYDAQIAHYEALNDPEFIAGWRNRALGRLQAALALA